MVVCNRNCRADRRTTFAVPRKGRCRGDVWRWSRTAHRTGHEFTVSRARNLAPWEAPTLADCSSLAAQRGSRYIGDVARAQRRHVVYKKDLRRWEVRAEGARRATKSFSTQLDAVRYARSLAKRSGGMLVIHGRDGRIREMDSYEHAPRASRFGRR